MTVNHGSFVGRQGLLAHLERQLSAVRETATGRIISLRGRRQVGKSTVVERFVESSGTPYVYVAGVFQASMSKHLMDATSAIHDSTHPLSDAALLAQSPARTWQEWLGRLALSARSGPVIAVLDEFPWLVSADPTLEGELQAQWDRVLSKLPVLLVLIGSDVAMMERLTDHGRPLFGRVTPMVVPPLNPAEIALALPGRSSVEVLDALLITGGYPRLVLDLAHHPAPSTSAYVTSSFLDLYSPLVTTARLTLDAEFAEPQAAYQVLSTIGASEVAHLGFADVATAVGDEGTRNRAETSTTRALRTLTDAKGLVEREQPAWAPHTSRLRRYRVTDPYLRFWFRYVESHVDQIARGRGDIAQAHFMRDWESWRGRSIEPVIREGLLRLAAHHPDLDGVEAVRPWWVRNNSVEVDFAAMTRDRTSIIGAIKWRTSGPVTSKEIDVLRQHRSEVPRATDALVAAVSPKGSAPRNADLAFSADDVLSAWAEPAASRHH